MMVLKVVEECELGDQGVCKLFVKLETGLFPRLEKMGLSGNGIGIEGMKMFVQANLSRIKDLQLSNIDINIKTVTTSAVGVSSFS